jgi:2-oxoglutarate ferredoxin oxidoreductase subunit beta
MKFDIKKLDTYAENTWCPGCGNFGILTATKSAIQKLVEEDGYPLNKFTLVSGIGCHAKIYDYLNINGFYSIHGRVLPTAIGIKLSNPELIVLGFGGDGDTYAEGSSHFLHAARYNADITMIVHNNQVFALTTGQATPTTERGYKGKSTPDGKWDRPMNPIALALVAGATFVARGFAYDVKHLSELIREGVKHRGFAYIDVIQPCVSFHNLAPYVKERMYRLEDEGHDPSNFEEALKKAMEWNYDLDPKARIPVGIFYRKKEETMEEGYHRKIPYYKVKRKIVWEKIIAEKKVL